MQQAEKAGIPKKTYAGLGHMCRALLANIGGLDKWKRQTAVAKARSLQEVRDICARINFTYFLDYDDQIDTKQREFEAAITHFNLSVEGKDVLDVGPGTADSLDFAKAKGAKSTWFVEGEPVFVKFARLKGHQGRMRNYYYKPFFPKSMKGQFDLIYTKGSINCDWVNKQGAYIAAGDPRGFFDFAAWVVALKDLLKGQGDIILVPAMGRQETRLIDDEYDLDTYYWCPDVEAYRNSHFAQTLIAAGFEVIDSIPGFTQPKAFPLAFYYKA